MLGHNAGCDFITYDLWEHIFVGHISEGGKITGYHHRVFGQDRGPLKMIKKTKEGKNGVYKGEVNYIDSRGDVHKKADGSTFFPDSWSPGTVKKEIITALYKALKKGNYNGKVVEKGIRGIKVEMRIKDGKIITAYPLLK